MFYRIGQTDTSLFIQPTHIHITQTFHTVGERTSDVKTGYPRTSNSKISPLRGVNNINEHRFTTFVNIYVSCFPKGPSKSNVTARGGGGGRRFSYISLRIF